MRYEPRAVAEHLEATALGRGSIAYHRLYHRNRLRLLWKHEPDEWLIRSWLPAELAYLRGTSDDDELEALMEVYLWWQAEFAALTPRPPLPSQATGEGEMGPIPPLPRVSAGEGAGGEGQSLRNSELDWLLGEVQRKSAPLAAPFRSRLPLVARMRELLSRLVLADYVRPLTQQQNDFNASAAELLAALVERTERQRRSADAAIACQAMLLAKVLGN